MLSREVGSHSVLPQSQSKQPSRGYRRQPLSVQHTVAAHRYFHLMKDKEKMYPTATLGKKKKGKNKNKGGCGCKNKDIRQI